MALASSWKNKVKAYEDLRRFEPEDLWKIEVELAQTLIKVAHSKTKLAQEASRLTQTFSIPAPSSENEEICKTAVQIYGRAILAKDDVDLADFIKILDPYFSLKTRTKIPKNYFNSLNKKDGDRLFISMP